MKYLNIFLVFVSLLSCTKTEKKPIAKEYFIISKFNSDIEKNIQDPEQAPLKEIEEYDYPKGAINFIILKDSTVYFYNEELIWNWCGWSSDKIKPSKRRLKKDSLHQINFNQIYPLLHYKSFEKNMKDGWNKLYPITFSFENDTIKDLDIKKLLQDVDSLGYHSFTVRKIAPFEQKAIKEKLK